MIVPWWCRAAVAAGCVLALPAAGLDPGEPATASCEERLEAALSAIAVNRAGDVDSLLRPCLETAAGDGPSALSVEIRLVAGQAALGVGNYRRALEVSREAAGLAFELGDPILQRRALSEVGDMQVYLGDPAAARESFAAALAYSSEVEEPGAHAEALKNLGVSELELGRTDLALWHFKQAQELVSHEHSPRLDLRVSISGNLGAVYTRLGAYNLALATYRDGLDAATVRGEGDEQVDLLLRIGGLYLTAGIAERAVEILEEAWSLAELYSAVPDRGWLGSMLAEAYEESGRPQAAIARLKANLAIKGPEGNPRDLAADQVTLGRLLAAERPDEAERLLAEAVEAIADLDAGIAARALAALADLSRERGELDAAIERVERGIDVLDRQRGEPVELDRGVGRSVYRTAVRLLLERGAPGDEARAFELVERALSWSTLRRQLLERIPLDPRLAPEFDERRQRVERRLAGLRERLDTAGSADRQDLLGRLAALQTEHRSLVKAIRRRSPDFAALHDPRTIGPEAVHELLEPGSALVTFFALDDRLVVLLLGDETLATIRLRVRPGALRERIDTYRELLARGRGEEWRAASRRLHRELVEPWIGRLSPGVDSLVLVLDPAIVHLPFESLLDGAAGRPEGRFLVQDFALTYVASATRWAQLTRLARSRPRREVSDALVVGPPVVSPSSREARERSRRTWQTYELEGLSAESLPDAGLEAQAVARHGGPGSVVVVGAEASESWLEQQDLSRYGVLHFATHSVLSVQSPARSALLLDGDETEDGFLQAREISQLRLAADLVVLSSCRTVQRPEIGSDGGQGIADSFLQAGATSVVASLWAVKDRDAADFMSTFYDHLAAGYSKAEALRRAKLDELARDPRSHPSRWAAFILLGEGHRDLHLLPRKPRRPWKWAGLATVVILVLGAAGRLRSRPPRPRSR